MTASCQMARLIHITLRQGNEGLLYATSPELKGLLVAGATRSEVEKEIPDAIAEMYAACGEKVLVTRLDADDTGDLSPWVAIPTEVARKALESEPTP
ncbi:hypothetical protein [Methyloceanibacter sp.]|uniref:hypothetical protein n=1 Tax=Methyloceanibacter sp. TaxID=1965321 RepID=UPI002D39E8BC|nr:hypothetical protein [Methyloceanibacter sp.]HZP08387.1 hypothetical protein [Methyloceanibacter sp.]